MKIQKLLLVSAIALSFSPSSFSQVQRQSMGVHYAEMSISSGIRRLGTFGEKKLRRIAENFCKEKGYRTAAAFYYERSLMKDQYVVADALCTNSRNAQSSSFVRIARTKIGLHRVQRGAPIRSDMRRLIQTVRVPEGMFETIDMSSQSRDSRTRHDRRQNTQAIGAR